MIKLENTRIRDYEEFIRDILNNIVQKIDFDKLSKEEKSFLTKIKERLCFDNDYGWKFLTSSLDILGDSQAAITSFVNKKNESGKNSSVGENYLRIYGLLSAVYIQQQSLLTMSELFKSHSIKRLKTDFDNLEITFLRHTISAHPINYNDHGIKVSYKIDRNSLNDNETLNLRDQSNNAKSFNIIKLLNEYSILAEECLEAISKKLISNCYKTANDKLAELNCQLNKIKESR